MTFSMNGCDFSQVPGVVIDHSPKSTGIYLGTPGIAISPDGAYVAKADEFGPGSGADTGGIPITRVFRSEDRGETWRRIAVVHGIYWCNLFAHQDALFMSGVNRSLGDIVVMKSTDGGFTWTTPLDEMTGLLKRGDFHTSSMPVLVHAGRLWRTMETFEKGEGGHWLRFRPMMLSIPLDADPLQARNWTFGEPAERDSSWLGGEWRTWLEGNPVLTPEGRVVNILRCDYQKGGEEKAMRVDLGEDGISAHFDPETGFLDFPGGCKKFNIRFDPPSGYYWTLANRVPERHWNYRPDLARNASALMRSRDLKAWEVRCALLYAPDIDHQGFQYADFLFDGEDIAAAYRVAHHDGLGGAHNMHDANFLTFNRIRNFRNLTLKDSVEPWLTEDLERANARREIPPSA